MDRDGPSRRERRNRTALLLVSGILALALLAAWTVILRRAPIEDDLTARAAAALEAVGIQPSDLAFEGRDGEVFVEAAEMESAGRVLGSLEGLRVMRIRQTPPPSTTTTTAGTTTTTTTTATTTTTSTTVPAAPEATFTLTASGGSVTLSGTLTAEDAADLLTAAGDTFGAESVNDSLTVDEQATRPGWTSALPGAIRSLEVVADPGVAVGESVVTLSGEVASEERRGSVLSAFGALGLEIADGLAVAAPPTQAEAAALQTALEAAIDDTIVLFETGSAAISAEGAAVLEDVADLLIAAPGARVEVGGHTDSEGPAEGNLVLSQDRAEAVAQYLIEQGVDPVQLTAVGYGEEQPIADNSTPEGRAANRRIEFIVEGSE